MTWGFVLSLVGVAGFVLAGKRVWWAWYVNIAAQVLWLIYAIVTDQPGFLLGVAVYSVVFTKNAIRWTRERHEETAEHEHKPWWHRWLPEVRRINVACLEQGHDWDVWGHPNYVCGRRGCTVRGDDFRGAP